MQIALEQEKRVSEEIFSLFELAREVKDYRAEQFLQWFVKEQVEEVSLMGDLLNVVERSKENLLLAEDYIAREGLGPGERRPDRLWPPAAGCGILARCAAGQECTPWSMVAGPTEIRTSIFEAFDVEDRKGADHRRSSRPGSTGFQYPARGVVGGVEPSTHRISQIRAPTSPARLRIVLMRRNSAMSSRRAAGAGAGRKRAGSGDSLTPSSRLQTR